MTTLYGVAGAEPWAKLTTDAEGNLMARRRNTSRRAPSSGSPAQALVGKKPYGFTGGKDGHVPFSTVVFDNHGNLYGPQTLGGTYTVLMGPGYCDTKESMVNSVTPSTVAWATKTLSKGSL